MKTLKRSIFLLGYTLSSTQILAQAYQFPEHRNIAIDNYNQTGFKSGPEIKKYREKSELVLGETIMVYDRYQRIYEKVGSKYEYVTSIARLDRLKVLDLNDETDNPYIKVEIESTGSTSYVGKSYYTRIIGLSEYEDYKYFDADVYMVQNIATEKLRVYHRLCKDYSCPPKMIFETDFVSGEKKNDPHYRYNTHVGSYRIFEWHKFYQDKGTGGHYPSWYDPTFPDPPSKKDSWSKWFDKEFMPWEYCSNENGEQNCSYKGMMRGAFGWYTALVEPHYGSGQWTHGTIGWGESSQDMIQRAKGEDIAGRLASVFTSLRSSGCSRVSNPSIAFLRHILPPGTPLLKIYALEAYQDQKSVKKNYKIGKTSVWNYTLTKDGVRETGEEAVSAHRNYVEQLGLATKSNILEKGHYEFRIYPTVVQYQHRPKNNGRGYWKDENCIEDTVDNYLKPGQDPGDEEFKYFDIEDKKSIRNRQCNVYRIPVKEFKGRFYPDTGLIDGYDHPDADGVIRGGFRSEKWPEFFEVNNYSN